MKVKKVCLQNFLSYDNLIVNFDDGLNVLVGKNAAGKTNLLESIYYSSLGKSARGMRDKELLRWGSNGGARITIETEKKFSKHSVDIAIDEQGKKRILVDRLPIAKIGELMGAICVVYFSPTELKLVKDAPSDRRRFMDISLCQRDRIYFYTLVLYNKLLAQRNKLLKDYKNSDMLEKMNNILIEKMCCAEEIIIKKRKAFLDALAPIAKEKHALLTSGQEELNLVYETEEVNAENAHDELKKLYEKSYKKDTRLEYTTIGVHRDDIKIVAGGIDVRKFGSQGQQRTVALSMKLAEAEMFKKETGEYPVLLLDDVLSELDASRRNALFTETYKMQTFLTCTDFEKPNDGYSIFEVHDGKVEKIEN